MNDEKSHIKRCLETFITYLKEYVDILSEIKKGGVLLYKIENEFFTVKKTKKRQKSQKADMKNLALSYG